MNYLTSLEVLGGVYIRFSDTPMDTAIQIASLYQWWQKKEHRSLLGVDESQARDLRRGQVIRVREPGVVEKWASALPHVGPTRARAAVKVFKSPMELAKGRRAQWLKTGVPEVQVDEVLKAIGGEK